MLGAKNFKVLLLSMVLVIFAFAPVLILVNSIPSNMLNWTTMYVGGAVFTVSVAGLYVLANRDEIVQEVAKKAVS